MTSLPQGAGDTTVGSVAPASPAAEGAVAINTDQVARQTGEPIDANSAARALAAELARSTANWTQRRPILQFDDSPASRTRCDVATAVMREHGYHPESPDNDGQGRFNVTYLSGEDLAVRTEERAAEQHYGPLSRLIGLARPREAFECVECGRWADLVPAAEVYSRLIQSEIGCSPEEWAYVRSSAQPTSPLRPSLLQREFGKTYDEAVAIIDAAVRLGLLDVIKRGVVAAQPRCASCYERRAAAPEPATSAPKGRDPIPPQLRFRVLQRDNFRCQYCGRAARDGAILHLDHVVPVAAGGATSEDNLITACDTCNLGKSAGEVV